MGFFKQESWSRWPFPPPGDFPNPGIKLGSPALQVDSFTIWATRKSLINLFLKEASQTECINCRKHFKRFWLPIKANFLCDREISVYVHGTPRIYRGASKFHKVQKKQIFSLSLTHTQMKTRPYWLYYHFSLFYIMKFQGNFICIKNSRTYSISIKKKFH